jgi:hypothetical protein
MEKEEEIETELSTKKKYPPHSQTKTMTITLKPSYKTRPDLAGRPGTRSTRWLDQSGFNKRLARVTARQNPVDPGEPGRDPVFFFFKFGI